MKKSFLFLIGVLLISMAKSQIRSVPAVVKSTIQQHYPDAKNVSYEDFLTRYRVHFRENKDSMTVTISNSGQIKSVSTQLDTSRIPAAVREGLSKSKYADWTIASVDKLEAPGADTQYVLEVDGGTILQKKNLYFSQSGQLLKDRRAL